MRDLSPTTDKDAASLAMENELLRYETLHLRARLAGVERRLVAANQELRRVSAAPAPGRATAVAAPGPAAAPQVDRSRNDLVWLLRRLDGSAGRWVVRRFSGFRDLKARYLEETP
ncbi:hypothetical protein CLV28_1996 [Sediminihabitans luteus]|uniref:PX domain-containing protein n=1 Tax=Sediminihabitans luteus TaxID=1138585 RepID=A0A2M9CE57_9CELL|nr:hypothetical protein [Sediminihabitans luteus]PJJ70167.1 hypothetical protein CLV28_1996 [Sediminihabitans luteus]GII97638.1 hypothetical protein Slu03_00160 [Sediminihabitans luteus]